MVYRYAQHSLRLEALSLIDMRLAAIMPDTVTFLNILYACSHAGYIRQGWHYFQAVKSGYGLERTMFHYACVVDVTTWVFLT